MCCLIQKHTLLICPSSPMQDHLLCTHTSQCSSARPKFDKLELTVTQGCQTLFYSSCKLFYFSGFYCSIPLCDLCDLAVIPLFPTDNNKVLNLSTPAGEKVHHIHMEQAGQKLYFCSNTNMAS